MFANRKVFRYVLKKYRGGSDGDRKSVPFSLGQCYIQLLLGGELSHPRNPLSPPRKK